ncbi:CoA-transferase [Streptomyces sp. NBC_01304]|uniref:CoA-transferase n=1 Tax=Streptomyces sp. NBC_01304 TaxID=2903818 RepID=UPI002E15A896|nr:hypothetical protein OG430_07105 [Streptomyces sp. NBC_01304]
MDNTDKVTTSAAEAISAVKAGSVLVLGDAVDGTHPDALLVALAEAGPRELAVVCARPDRAGVGLGLLLGGGGVARLVHSTEEAGQELPQLGSASAQFVPLRLLEERLQAGGAGAATFYAQVGTYAEPAADESHAVYFGGDEYGPVPALTGDLALLRAERGDRRGNLAFADEGREFAVLAAKACASTLAEVGQLVDRLEPHETHLSGTHVTCLLAPRPTHQHHHGG